MFTLRGQRKVAQLPCFAIFLPILEFVHRFVRKLNFIIIIIILAKDGIERISLGLQEGKDVYFWTLRRITSCIPVFLFV